MDLQYYFPGKVISKIEKLSTLQNIALYNSSKHFSFKSNILDSRIIRKRLLFKNKRNILEKHPSSFLPKVFPAGWFTIVYSITSIDFFVFIAFNTSDMCEIRAAVQPGCDATEP